VSGVLVSPVGTPPSEGRPVVAIAPGTSGLADECGQSKTAELLISSPLVQRHLESGHVVVATDYEGLGTPGLHPYGVGESAGRSLLDAARTATQITDAGAGTSVVLGGHSQGGHTAFFAGALAPTYAPELEVLGVVAVAPPIDLVALMRNASAAPGALGWVVMYVRGFAAAYPELDVDLVLTESALTASDVVDRACVDDVLAAFGARPAREVLLTSPADVPAWRETLERNSLRPGRVAAPVLLVKGDADELLPKTFTDLFVEQLCAAEDPVEYRVYGGATHSSVLAASAADSHAWIADRFDGVPASSTCPGHS
jgi:pimeloyl-ACP methyl ester carboxylesterase